MSVMYSQLHIIKECTHKDILACRTKHVKLLKRLLSDRSAQRWLIAPYFKKMLDFAMARTPPH